jgi:hypothetical protein
MHKQGKEFRKCHPFLAGQKFSTYLKVMEIASCDSGYLTLSMDKLKLTG